MKIESPLSEAGSQRGVARGDAGRNWQSQLEQQFMSAMQGRATAVPQASAEGQGAGPDVYHAPRLLPLHDDAAVQIDPRAAVVARAGTVFRTPEHDQAWRAASLADGHPYSSLVRPAEDAPDSSEPYGVVRQETPDTDAPAIHGVLSRLAHERSAAPPTTQASTPIARRWVQVSTTAEVHVAVRDADVVPGAEQAVAADLAAELRAEGHDVTRVFVNGRRFEFTPRAPQPRRPTIPDQE